MYNMQVTVECNNLITINNIIAKVIFTLYAYFFRGGLLLSLMTSIILFRGVDLAFIISNQTSK